jgi:hypothetical protein
MARPQRNHQAKGLILGLSHPPIGVLVLLMPLAYRSAKSAKRSSLRMLAMISGALPGLRRATTSSRATVARTLMALIRNLRAKFMGNHSAPKKPEPLPPKRPCAGARLRLGRVGLSRTLPALHEHRPYAALRKGTTTAGADGVVAKSDHACIIGLRFSISLLRW